MILLRSRPTGSGDVNDTSTWPVRFPQSKSIRALLLLFEALSLGFVFSIAKTFWL